VGDERIMFIEQSEGKRQKFLRDEIVMSYHGREGLA
jgi:hypothetical protein